MRFKERIEESVEERGSDTALCVAYILYIATLHIGESHDTLHYNTRGSYGLSIEDENILLTSTQHCRSVGLDALSVSSRWRQLSWKIRSVMT